MKISIMFLALAFIVSAQAKDLPNCDDLEVQKAFIDAVRPTDRIFEIKNWKATTDGKQWCYAFFPGSYLTGRDRTPYMQALYTLEWINEAEGHWWFQLKTLEKTCRGANGDRNSLERCKPFCIKNEAGEVRCM